MALEEVREDAGSAALTSMLDKDSTAERNVRKAAIRL